MHIRGVELNVRVSGSGLPLLWGHGLMMSMAAEDTVDWFHWSQFPQDLRLVRYDARGHGGSQPSYRAQDYGWPNLGRDMLALADATGAGRFIAGGASMGCATALNAALLAPERVKALLLVIPPTAWETRAAQGRFYRNLALVGRVLGGRRLAALSSRNMDRMLPSWLVQAERDKLAGLGEGVAALSGRTLWSLMRGAGQTNLPGQEQFAAIVDIPTAIFAWEGDRSHPVSSAQALHALLPKSELFVAQNLAEFKSIPVRMREFAGQFA